MQQHRIFEAKEIALVAFLLCAAIITANPDDAPPPLDSRDMFYKHFRRQWGDQKIRVVYTICRAMNGTEYALVTDVLADVPRTRDVNNV